MSSVCARHRDPRHYNSVACRSAPVIGWHRVRGRAHYRSAAFTPLHQSNGRYRSITMNDIKKLSCLLMCKRPVDIILQIQIALMTSKTKMILSGAFAALTGLVALDAVYLLGNQHGSRDALNWDFSGVVGGKVVPLGNGSQLLRGRIDIRPARNANIVSMTFTSTNDPR